MLTETRTPTSPPGAIPSTHHSGHVRDPKFVAAICYALLVIAMWGPFAFSSGMPYETSFAYWSQTHPVWKGFLYEGDALRIHTSTFYQLSYVLGKALGVTGSFVPYQFVYAALWWAKGFLLFLILRRLFPASAFLAYVVGTLALVHASDWALQWVGQLNQLGFAFWLLLCLYFFVVALQQSTTIRTGTYLAFACLFQYMCLWSYESPLFIILGAPAVIAFMSKQSVSKRLLVSSGIWYVVPLIYVGLSLNKYLHPHGPWYQETVLRRTWSVGSLLNDLGFNMYASIAFWSWPMASSDMSEAHTYALVILGVFVFLIGTVVSVRWTVRDAEQGEGDRSIGVAFRLLAGGLILLGSSFPVYLMLDSARSRWRTQLLSSIAAAMTLGAASFLITAPISRVWVWVWPRKLACVGLAALVVFIGASRAIERGATHRSIWRRHQLAMQEVIRTAPEVRQDVIFVLQDVPKANDPFRDAMWFDMALRLAYPGMRVAGIYYYDDGSPAPGDNFKLISDHWHWDGTGFPPLIQETTLAQTIVIQYRADHGPGLLTNLPRFLCLGPCSPELYNPKSDIIGHTPSPVALRRYGPV